MTGYFDLGSHHRPVPASSPGAQLWFDRGLIWAYAFNHEEAVRCFERAIEADPGCAIGAAPAERALIAAIAARYPAPAPPVDAAAWNESYARAMRQAHLDHPGDLDIAALFADSL